MPKFTGRVRAIFKTAEILKSSKQAALFSLDTVELAEKMERAGVQHKDYTNDLLSAAPEKILFWVRKKDLGLEGAEELPKATEAKLPCDVLQRMVSRGQFGGNEDIIV